MARTTAPTLADRRDQITDLDQQIAAAELDALEASDRWRAVGPATRVDYRRNPSYDPQKRIRKLELAIAADEAIAHLHRLKIAHAEAKRDPDLDPDAVRRLEVTERAAKNLLDEAEATAARARQEYITARAALTGRRERSKSLDKMIGEEEVQVARHLAEADRAREELEELRRFQAMKQGDFGGA